MATTNNRISELAFKYLIHDLSETDNIELEQLLREPTNKKLFDEVTDRRRIEAAVKIMRQAETPIQARWMTKQSHYYLCKRNLAAIIKKVFSISNVN